MFVVPASAARRSLLRIELQRRRVDAVSQPSRPRAVVEHVTQMRVASGAQDFRPEHSVAAVDVLVHAVVGDRAGKARPTAARIEFRIGLEEFGTAAYAAIDAGRRRSLILAGEGPFGGLLACDSILLWRQLRTPFTVGLLDLVRHRGTPRIVGVGVGEPPDVVSAAR